MSQYVCGMGVGCQVSGVGKLIVLVLVLVLECPIRFQVWRSLVNTDTCDGTINHGRDGARPSNRWTKYWRAMRSGGIIALKVKRAPQAAE